MKYFALIFLQFIICLNFVLSQNKTSTKDIKISEKEIQATELYIDAMKEKNLGNFEKALEKMQKVIVEQPQNAAAHFEASQICISLEKYSEGIKLAEKAVSIDENNTWFKEYLVELYTRSGDVDKASKLYEQIIKNAPNDLESILQYSYILIKSENYKKALEVLNQAEKKGLTHEMLHIQKHQIYLRLNDFNNAENEIKKLIILDPTEMRHQVTLAEFYDNNLKKELALKTFQNILLIEPSNPKALIYLSNYYLKQNDTLAFKNTSIKLIENKEIELDSKIAYLGYGLMNFSKLDAAQKSFYISLTEKLADFHPIDAKSHSILGDFHFLNENNEKASLAYKNSLKYRNDIFEVWQNLFSTLFSLSKYKELADSSQSAIEYFPANPLVHYFNGIANLQIEQYSISEKSLRKAIRFAGDNPKLEAQIYNSLGELFHKQKKYKEMDEAYENAIKLEPNNPFTLNNYAYYLSLRKNQLERAKKMSRKTLDIAPDNGSFLDTYAWICFQLGQYQEALLYQEKAVEIEKEDKKTIYEHYGDILSKVGNIEKAIIYWQKSMDAGNSNKVLKQKISEKKYIESNE